MMGAVTGDDVSINVFPFDGDRKSYIAVNMERNDKVPHLVDWPNPDNHCYHGRKAADFCKAWQIAGELLRMTREQLKKKAFEAYEHNKKVLDPKKDGFFMLNPRTISFIRAAFGFGSIRETLGLPEKPRPKPPPFDEKRYQQKVRELLRRQADDLLKERGKK